MTRPYLVLVNGVLAKRRMTLQMAVKDMNALKAKGFNNVSVAEDIQGGN